MYPQLTWTEMLQFYAKLHTISHTKLKERVALIESLLKLDGYGSRRICTLRLPFFDPIKKTFKQNRLEFVQIIVSSYLNCA